MIVVGNIDLRRHQHATPDVNRLNRTDVNIGLNHRTVADIDPSDISRGIEGFEPRMTPDGHFIANTDRFTSNPPRRRRNTRTPPLTGKAEHVGQEIAHSAS